METESYEQLKLIAEEILLLINIWLCCTLGKLHSLIPQLQSYIEHKNMTLGFLLIFFWIKYEYVSLNISNQEVPN